MISAPPGAPWFRLCAWVTGFVVTTGLLVVVGRTVITWSKVCPGFVSYWSAAVLLSQGESPYDLARLKTIQLEHGWDKTTDGFGFFDFLANYYPPSLLAVIGVALVPLGFQTARMTWLVLNVELLFLTAYMLRRLVPSVSGRVSIVLVPFFCLSVMSVLVGQVTALILFATVVVWWLMQNGWDRSAGWLLAWTAIKPPLTALLALSLLLWSWRKRRWLVLKGFVAGATALLLVSLWLVPSWPVELVRSMRETPFVTAVFPWVGTTWSLVLRSLGARAWMFWLLYAALAVPFLLIVLRYAWSDEHPLEDVVAISLLAAFFVAPTARPYDQPILLIPLLVLVAKRRSDAVAGALLFLLMVVPYAQFFMTPVSKHVWFFWIPAVLTAAWFAPPTRR